MSTTRSSSPKPPNGAKRPDPEALLKLEVPIVVRLAERQLPVQDVLRFVPGSLIELPKDADDELDLMVNNKAIGQGTAVKVGENFGLKVTFIGDLRSRLEAMTGSAALGGGGANAETTPSEADALAEQMLSGQV